MKNPAIGSIINGYTIGDNLHVGGMANGYVAKSPTGQKVFFKAYKSPSVAIGWFKKYVAYQKTLSERVKQPSLRRFCVQLLDAFVFKYGSDTFYQVYEFIEGGHDMGTLLEKIQKRPKEVSWEQRTIMARVLMAGIHNLHEQKIVHGDLKPANLQMLIDPSITAGYQLKLIDMDFSLLSDKVAPWHGVAPYVGTPRYFSPEHLRGETPVTASDIFTCGIILYELLGGGHPYATDDDAEYKTKVENYKVTLPKLLGTITDDRGTRNLAETLHKCLSPDATKRPTAQEVNNALNGKMVPPPKAPPEITVNSQQIKLVDNAGATLSLNLTGRIGRQLLRRFGEHSQFAADHQFTLEKRDAGWILIPQVDSPNHTMYNNEVASKPIKLKSGDTIAIGGRKSGKIILPLKVEL